MAAAVAAVAALALLHTDEIHRRAELALGRGMPAREAALARGFVLGEDDRVDPSTVEDFRRAGLAHLLAVSGQNVALLALLAMPLLAALGIPLRDRLLWILALIVVYVPLAGAGPSIQRAAVMGALSVIAMLGGRRAPRLYALAVAALVTLAADPGIAHQVGWQLSFAAVAGILLLGGPLRRAMRGRSGAGGPRAALGDAAAMTIAATLATGPLIAFHFGAVSTATLLANLLAMPAVAPAMWLGMLAAAGGQVPGFPVEAVNALNAPLLAYIAQIAAWCGRPDWAYLEVSIGAAGLLASYLGLAAVLAVAALLSRRARLSAARRGAGRNRSRPRSPRRSAAALAALAAAVAVLGLGAGTGSGERALPRAGLRVSVLDVGQGDAILLQPARAPAVLVDAGPPEAGLLGKLREAGVERLGAVVITHDQSDHSGGLPELVQAGAVAEVLYAALRRETRAALAAAGVRARRLTGGGGIRSGQLRLEALWPPPELLGPEARPGDPNGLSLVLLARLRGFSMLLTGDAEAESVPLDPGPVDVLKVAHHGSEDAGLDGLLDRSGPRLAIVSVGADNPYGHPAPATLAGLAAHTVPVMRTDRDGSVVLDVMRGSIRIDDGD